MKRISLFIIVTLLFHYGVKGNPFWVPINNSSIQGCITITAMESNENKYKAKIEIQGYFDNPVVINDSVYHQVSFDEPASLSFVGEPALPIISRLIAIPKGENFEVSICEEKWSEDFFVGQVMPHQRSVLETEEKPLFEKNMTVYSEDEYQIERIHIGELQSWRGINNRALNICPIRYMPKEGKMSVLKEFVLEISFDSTVAATSTPMKSRDMRLFLNQTNISDGERIKPLRESSESYDYLIIAGDIPGVLESQALADFQRWKAFKGYRTKVVSTNTIGSLDNPVKQYISNEYDKGVKYVLFLGDNSKIALHHYHNYYLPDFGASDYWYGCMGDSTDVEADINIGRFPASNLSELSNMIYKTISYEGTARSYGNEVLLVAHHDDSTFDFRKCSEAIRLGNYNELMSFTTAYGKTPYEGVGATNDSVINEINEGKNIINYRGKGTENCWFGWSSYGESFRDTDINSLNNSTNDVYFCIGAFMGRIWEDECFLKTFMRSNHGAVSMIAAEGYNYREPSHSFDQNLFIKMLNDNIYNFGDLNVAAHMATIGSATGNEREMAIFNAFNYLCGGDPSLEIITNVTSNFDDYTLSLNGQDLNVNCNSINGYKVCIVDENDSLLSVVNSTNATCSLPMPTDNFYLVLNKHNYVPRIIYVNVADTCIQNKVFDNTDVDYYYIKDATICAGYDVTTSIPYGNVIIENGSKLNINKKKGVRIKNGFKCQLGGELQIK